MNIIASQVITLIAIFLINYSLLPFFILKVGVDPVSVTFSADCHYVVTANAGLFGLDSGDNILDPPGTFTVIPLSGTGQPSARTVTLDTHDDIDPAL